MATVDERIKLLEEKLKQEKAKKQKLEARRRHLESKAQRATDTRKKILVGAFMLDLMEKNEATRIKALSQLDSYLTRPDDRAIFGFASMPAKAPAASTDTVIQSLQQGA